MSDARQLGSEAFVFGFPLLTMAATMRYATNVRRPIDGRAPPNQFAHLSRFPDPRLTTVAAANADTLYSLAWLNLAAEPILLTLPDTGGRSYLLPLVDAWTNVIACLGPRTKGSDEVYAIVGPDWDGELPADVQRIDSPTNAVWAIGHIHAFGSEMSVDVEQAVQRHLSLSPLSTRGETQAAPEGAVDAEIEDGSTQPVAALGAEGFLRTLAFEMDGNPPALRDLPLLDRLASIGLRPGEPFDWAGIAAELRAELELGLVDGHAVVGAPPVQSGENGWRTHGQGLGAYGLDYRRRAQVANVALGTVPAEDASFPISSSDSGGVYFHGEHRYLLRFEAGALPPANALWSLGLYDLDQLFVANPIDRYALGDRDELELGPDGSLEISIQHERPAGSSANWLPAPAGGFNLMLHMYWPDESMLEGRWTAPSVERLASVEQAA